MAAGDSADNAARQQTEEALWHFSRANRFAAGAVGERLVAAALQPLLELGWILLEDRAWSKTSPANIDLIVVGPGGVVVVDAKNWRASPRVFGGKLMRGDRVHEEEVGTLLAATRRVESAVAELGVSPVAVSTMMAFARRRVDLTHGRVRLVGGHNAAAAIAGLPIRLTPTAVATVAAHLSTVFPEAPLRQCPDGVEQSSEARPAPMTLFDVYETLAEHERSARQGPIEDWMTFLDPAQNDLVRRHWNGPARVSGPAGTGKSVVGLHRAAHLARGGGQVLFVTFVNSLPRVQANLVARLAPDVAGRIRFSSVHGWAMSLLAERGLRIEPNPKAVASCFNLAWLRAGRGELAHLDPRADYWREEIDHVIKGRGVTDLDEYRTVRRRGRRTSLQGHHREAVWNLFLEYERVREERGLVDFADVLLRALASVRAQPPPKPYTAVILDEAQDLSLTGLRLLHALVGDVPNGLLLIGDAQQAVYPGGYRLADAGISIRGARSHVLRVNYRNGRQISDAFAKVIAGAPVEDLDGGTVLGSADVAVAGGEGRVTDVLFASAGELDNALVEAISEVGDFAASAVLCTRNRDVLRYETLLRRAGMRTQNLKDYDGRPNDAVKVGTFLRGKGLEFKHVFLPHFDQALSSAATGGAADTDRMEIATRQLHVAMSRARDTLWRATLIR